MNYMRNVHDILFDTPKFAREIYHQSIIIHEKNMGRFLESKLSARIVHYYDSWSRDALDAVGQS